MDLGFLDRERERERLENALSAPGGALVCLYGRRRLGKSKLLVEALRSREAVYYVGDDRAPPLQRAALAREMGRLVPGFEAVTYPDWEPLLERWWKEAPRGAALALDEFPSLVAASPEFPSLLQKFVDRGGRHVALCGSSQRMMQGLVLDTSAALYGRAREILRLEPMSPYWLGRALRLGEPAEAVRHHGVWGGVPRYWELAAEHAGLWPAVERLALEPLGVLHREPDRLLLDEMSEIGRAGSVLALAGQGCHRLSEIAGRLGLPATSLARPLARLTELGFLERLAPFGDPERSGKRSIYRIADPFLRFWYRFVEPNRSRLGPGQVAAVRRSIQADWPVHLGGIWEDLARWSAARLEIGGHRWTRGSRWWGRTRDGQPVELDVLAEAEGEPGTVLAGEAKLRATERQIPGLLAAVERKAAACPVVADRRIVPALWILEGVRSRRRPAVLTARDVVRRP